MTRSTDKEDTMRIPRRITFQWLYRTLPEIDNAKDFNRLVAALEAKGWLQEGAYNYGSNFYGMLLYGLKPWVRREVQRQAQ